MDDFDVAIVGAGIAGLSVARELALRGVRVLVLERDSVGSHASSAAAGILTSRGAVDSSRPGRSFYLRSLVEYPRWAEQLASESGLPVEIEEGEDWCVFPAGPAASRFRSDLDSESDPSAWEEVSDFPPEFGIRALPTDWRIFRFFRERWTDPRRLLPALASSAANLGARILSDCGEVRLHRDGRNWGLHWNRGATTCSTVLVAAGPWTPGILSPVGWSCVSLPVRGQLALVPRLHPVQSMIHLEDMCYAVPRGAFTLVGATMEHGSIEEEVTPGGLSALQDKLRPFFPGLDLSKAHRAWSGIRPRTRDRLPHLGRLEDGLFVASGHFRSGISMAARGGHVVADIILGSEPAPDILPLSPLRPGGWRRNWDQELRLRNED